MGRDSPAVWTIRPDEAAGECDATASLRRLLASQAIRLMTLSLPTVCSIARGA
jgi:hypothetical protein